MVSELDIDADTVDAAHMLVTAFWRECFANG